MSTEEESKHIHALLLLMEKQPTNYQLSEYEGGIFTYRDDAQPIVNRLLANDLVTARSTPTKDNRANYYLDITDKGIRIAREPDGYMGNLQRKKREEHKTAFNARVSSLKDITTILTFLLALLAFINTIRIQRKNSEQVELLSKRLDVLERLSRPQNHVPGTSTPVRGTVK